MYPLTLITRSVSRPCRVLTRVVLAAMLLPALAAAQGPDSILYTFQAVNDGSNPRSVLVADSAGNLYGTTFSGGLDDAGTVFELSPAGGGTWKETILFNFSFAQLGNGTGPSAGLVMDKNGNLFGTTWIGGTGGGGNVFELSPPGSPGEPWSFQEIYDFSGTNDGWSPQAGLAFDSAGNLYGTTTVGGNNLTRCMGGCGTVFRLTPPKSGSGFWKELILYNFPGTGGEDGVGGSESGVTVGPDGSVYGTTLSNPTKAKGRLGNIFRLTPKGNKKGTCKFSVVYKFDPPPDGFGPAGGVALDPQGNIYGTTYAGGSSDSGTVFQLLKGPDGIFTENILYSFQNGADGAFPLADLIMDGAGNLYGTASMGGNFACTSYGCGVVFEVSPPSQQGGSWTESTLHAFAGGSDGLSPFRGLTFGLNGQLYGTTDDGGSFSCGGFGCGTVYSVTP